VLLFLLTLALYFPGSKFEFLNYDFINLDDVPFVQDNPHLHQGVHALSWAFKAGLLEDSPHVDYWQPLTVFSRALEVSCFGMRPQMMHLVNLLFHLFNTVLLYKVLWQMTGSERRSALAALLFAIHPLRVESVMWITERKDVLCGFFSMLTLWSYDRYRLKKNLPRYLLTGTFIAFSLMAKPSAITLPLILSLLDFWPFQRFRRESPASLVMEKIPFLFLSIISAAFTMVSQASHLESKNGVPLIQSTLANVGTYLLKSIIPTGLGIWHPPGANISILPILLGSTALLLISFLALRNLRERPWLFMGWAWFLIGLAPTIHLKDISWAERFTYFPSIGLFIMLGWTLPSPRTMRLVPRRILMTSVAALIALFSILTFLQVPRWKDSFSLYEHTLAVEPNNPLILNNLALACIQIHDWPRAQTLCEKALRLQPDFAEAWNNLGTIAFQRNQYPEAISYYRKATRAKLDLAAAHDAWAAALNRERAWGEAIRHGELALRLNPTLAAAHLHLADAYQHTGRFEEAFRQNQEAFRLQPDSVTVLCNLGSLLLRFGKTKNALDLYAHGLELHPEDPDLWNNFGNATLKSGRPDQALSCYLHAIEFRPQFPEAHASLGAVYALEGNHLKAIEHERIALQLQPDDLVARYNLAVSLIQTGNRKEASDHLRRVANQSSNVELARQAQKMLSQPESAPKTDSK